MKISEAIKYRVRKAIKKRPLKNIYLSIRAAHLFIRTQKPVTKLFGPCHTRSQKYIEIDITYLCNLACLNCNRSSGQAPSAEQMTVEQINKFIKESISNNIRWNIIRLVGGEPTLHSDIIEIIEVLLEYVHNYSPRTQIHILTNGFGKTVNDILSKLPKEICVVNSSKSSSVQLFHPFNTAPGDFFMYKNTDYSNGCWALSQCGLGLNPYGYYPCPQAGGIDRIFGFDIGRKKIPSPDDKMVDQLKALCRLCGNFIQYNKPTDREMMSPAWEKAYEKYKQNKPSLTPY